MGGHTSCLAVWADGDPSPNLLLDAGTGIRSVSDLLAGHAFDGTILLTHLHWDHVQGLPFFAAGDRDDARVRLLLPVGSVGGAVDPGRAVDPDSAVDAGRDAAALEALRRSMSPPSFPIGPDGLRGDWSIGALDEGKLAIGDLDVLVREVPHKGGPTMGIRLDDGATSVAYIPDHLPAGRGTDGRLAALELAADVDLLIHDAQFTQEEAVVAELYGHATIEQAIELAEEAGVATLALTHHSPGRTDAEVAALERRYAGCGVALVIARDGLDLLGAPSET